MPTCHGQGQGHGLFILATYHKGKCVHAHYSDPVGSALGCWVKEGLGLVVHIPSGCVARINIP
jgi:hypothetical protein